LFAYIDSFQLPSIMATISRSSRTWP